MLGLQEKLRNFAELQSLPVKQYEGRSSRIVLSTEPA
tara:strand:- start:18540 stop:18650 length:111 start_codon:yes stop_codon:yes gene_type:complete